jgi:hypothetical protein
VRLAIHAPVEQMSIHRKALDVPPVVELRPWVPQAELPRVFHAADFLVHVESFDTALAEYTRLSFSTKLTQYMMAGRCILGIGPADLGSMRTIQSVGAGMTISDLESDSFLRAVEQLLQDFNQQRECARRGRQWAVEWTERRAGHERFRRDVVAALHRSRCRTRIKQS